MRVLAVAVIAVAALNLGVSAPAQDAAKIEKGKAARKPPIPAFGPDKIADGDLDALVAYLASLTKK
jgi:hypothetical protein